MDPQLNDILKKAYADMDAKGIPAAQRKPLIEKLANDYNSSKGGGSAPTEQKPGFFQGLVQDVTKPFLKPVASLRSAADSVFDPAQGQTDREQGVDLGYFGKVKPFGAYGGDGPTGGDVLRAGADVAGSAAEAASYFMAPLKTAGGFWNTLKEVAPIAATFGTGKGLEAAGEGKNLTDSVTTGLVNAGGAAAGYGLFKGGANLFANWGARALQSDAVRVAGQQMKNLADYTWNALPEAFQKGVTSLSDFTNATTRRTVASLKSQFDETYNTAKNAVIDGIMPTVNQPDLVFSKFQRNLSESMGNMFRKSNALYDDVKADTTTVDTFSHAQEALGKLPKVPTLGSKLTPEEFKTYQEAAKNSSESMQSFVEDVGAATKQPLTLKQVMTLWNNSMSYLTKATNEEKVVIRDFAAGLYADARSVLEKKNPELLNQWDMAYQSWKKATDVYESSVLNNLKSSGDVDTFIDNMVGKGMTRAEGDAFVNSLGENKKATQDLFINSILAKAKTLNPEEGAKLINDFLDNVGDKLLSPEQAKMLDDVGQFMSGNFDQFVLGMRQAKGLTDETAGDLLKGQTQLDLMKTVNDGRLDEIAGKFSAMKDSPDLEKTLEAFTPDEKNVIGLSITKDMFDEKLPVAALNPNGTYKISPEFASTLVETAQKIAENKALQKVLSPDQLTALQKAAEFAEKMKDTSEVPAAGFHRLLNGLISVFYFARGWVPGGIRNAIEAASGQGEKSLRYYDAVSSMIDEGVLKKNTQYKIGDFMKVLLPGAGQVTDESGSQVTK